MVCKLDHAIMEPAFNACTGLLGGWVCPKCCKPVRAFGRERQFTRETLAAADAKVAQITRAA